MQHQRALLLETDVPCRNSSIKLQSLLLLLLLLLLLPMLPMLLLTLLPVLLPMQQLGDLACGILSTGFVAPYARIILILAKPLPCFKQLFIELTRWTKQQ
jgi:hypothetical protein